MNEGLAGLMIMMDDKLKLPRDMSQPMPSLDIEENEIIIDHTAPKLVTFQALPY